MTALFDTSEAISKLAYELHKEGLLTSVLTNRKLVKQELEKKRLFVIEAAEFLSNKVLGFIHFNKRKRDNVIVIYEIGIDREHRRQGLGTALIQKLMKDLYSDLDFEAKCSLRNCTAVNFWLNLDFVPIKLERRWNKSKGRYSDFVVFRRKKNG